jgi:hypothetical protein
MQHEQRFIVSTLWRTRQKQKALLIHTIVSICNLVLDRKKERTTALVKIDPPWLLTFFFLKEAIAVTLH